MSAGEEIRLGWRVSTLTEISPVLAESEHLTLKLALVSQKIISGPGIIAPFYSQRNWGADKLSVDTQIIAKWGLKCKPAQLQNPCSFPTKTHALSALQHCLSQAWVFLHSLLNLKLVHELFLSSFYLVFVFYNNLCHLLKYLFLMC